MCVCACMPVCVCVYIFLSNIPGNAAFPEEMVHSGSHIFYHFADLCVCTSSSIIYSCINIYNAYFHVYPQ